MKKGGEKKKSNDSTLSFYICYFGAFGRKEVYLEEIYLALTFSKFLARRLEEYQRTLRMMYG